MLLALLSHFLLDVLPHYGQKSGDVISWFKHRTTWLVEGLNIIGVPLLIYLLWGQPWWVFAAAAIAILPDVVWIFRYVRYDRFGLQVSQYSITKWHTKIQWGERPWGFAVEIPFFLLAVMCIALLVY